MGAWDEFVAFVRGTRPRPPPGPRKPLAALLLVAASLAHLPLVYALVRDVQLVPVFTLAVGLTAMGLAWSGGVSLEGRRRGTARAIAAIAVAEGSLAVVPVVADAIGPARWLFVLSALLAGAGLAVLVRSP